MAVGVVDVQVKVQNIAEVARLSKRLDLLEDQVKDLNAVNGKLSKSNTRLAESFKRTKKQANDSAQALKKYQTEANKSSKSVGRLNGLLGRFALGAAAIAASRYVLLETSQLQTQTRSLEILTGELSTAKSIIAELQRFGSITPFTPAELVDTARQLKAFGVDTEKLVETTKRLADVSGATGAELKGVALAYGQIQAKGRIQGEELLQLQERGIGLQKELQKMYGLTGDEFRKALEKGQFSAEAAELAIKNLTSAGGVYANGAIAQSDTLAGKFNTLIGKIQQTAQAIGKILTPQVISLLDWATKAVSRINELFTFGQDGKIASLENRYKELLNLDKSIARVTLKVETEGDPTNALTFDLQSLEKRRQFVLKDIAKLLAQIPVKAPTSVNQPNKIPDLLNPTGNTTDNDAGAAAVETAKDYTSEIERAVKEVQNLNIAATENAVLLTARNDLEKINTQYVVDQLAIARKYADLYENQFLPATARVTAEQAESLEQQNLLVKKTKALQEIGTDAGNAFADWFVEIDDAVKPLTKTEELTKGIYEIFAGGMTDAIKGLIAGTKDLNDVLSEMLGKLGDLFLNAAFSGLGSSLKIPGYAEGGRPTINQLSVVGERGPELFIPDTAGTIVSNEDAFGAARGAMASSGATQASNTAEAAELAAAEAADRSSSQSSTVRFETLSIGSLDVVTREEAERIGKQSAKQAESSVLRGLRNRPATRSKAGIS